MRRATHWSDAALRERGPSGNVQRDIQIRVALSLNIVVATPESRTDRNGPSACPPHHILYMTFVDRARDFIRLGGDESALLLDCVADGGANALAATQVMAEDMYGGITYNIELKAPAAVALVAFGKPGLLALAELANRTPRSKNVSLCISILASVAAGVSPSVATVFVQSDQLKARIDTVAKLPGIADAARVSLREYVLGIESELTAVSAIGSQLSGMGAAQDPAVIGELFAALAARRLTTGPTAIRKYQDLMESRPNDEPAFHEFFALHSQLLDPAAAEVWSKPDLVGAREPDFVIRRTDDSYLVVEIETPGKSLVTGANQLSAFATQAIAQAADYRSFLIERFQLAAKYFPRFSEPDCLVVIGREDSLSDPQRAALIRDNRTRMGLRVVGYDWIARRALAISRNVVEPQLTAQSIRVL